jgi:membrane protein implicated in regulation of membrane protease activity
MSTPEPSSEDKTAIAITSLIAGAACGVMTSVMSLGVCLIFLPVSTSFGVAITTFFPVLILTARSSARLARKKLLESKKQQQ